MDVVDIARSWFNVVKHTPEQLAQATERLVICDGCDQKQIRPLVEILVCGACGCPLKSKVYSQRGCPLGKW